MGGLSEFYSEIFSGVEFQLTWLAYEVVRLGPSPLPCLPI